MRNSASRCLFGLLLLTAPAVDALAGKISFSSLPTLSSSVLVTDDTTPYTVTLTASAAAGYNDITSMRILFNFTETGGDSTQGRGYLAWGTTDADITNYGGTWVFADATGGGRWAYQTAPWDGTPYLTPLACSTTTQDNATGGTGKRTVTFTFTAKAGWAGNPLINDADAWAMTANDGPNESDFCKVGWADNPSEFVVVAGPCAQNAATPSAPLVSNPTADTIEVAIEPTDSDTDLFAIRIAPPRQDAMSHAFAYEFVQADGTIGGAPAWRTKSAWGTTPVSGLSSNTAYTFTACAWNESPGTCPSSWSPPADGATALRSHAIDCAAAGTAIHPGVDGMNHLPWPLSSNYIADLLASSVNTGVRFGGDGYNWKTRTAQWNSRSTSTLEFLRYARDRNSYLQMLTNTRGIGTGNGPTWVYTDQTPATLAALTADWVYYCNVLVQTRRQGDALTPREQALLDSLGWGTDDKLLAPGESPVPRVVWWEIGNEPEGPYPPPSLTPADYANRYNIISTAMLAEDPTIKVGPGCMTANNGNAWLDAVFANPANSVDFVAYHPYGNLYHITRDSTGGNLNASSMMRGLNVQKSQQLAAKQKMVERLTAHNRPADTDLLITEWNPSSWQGTYYYSLSRTVGHGLGVAENILTFAGMNIVASQYWDQPNAPSTPGIEVPGFKVFKAMQDYLPDRLMDSLSDGCFRLYATKDSQYRTLVLWAINLHESADKSIRVQLLNLPPSVAWGPITRRTLGAYSGDTTLTMLSTTTELVGWTESDLTGLIDPADFTLTFDNATLTLLIFDLDYLTNAPMVLSPTAFERTAYVGTSLPDDGFAIASGGPDWLSYTIDPGASWLSVTPASGQADSAGDAIVLGYHLAGLPPGEHSATITVVSNEAYNSPRTIDVQLTITTSDKDFDHDGDIDLDDFAHIQACLTGAYVPQNNPACQDAKMDGDSDVDRVDMGIFIDCLGGSHIPPTLDCAN